MDVTSLLLFAIIVVMVFGIWSWNAERTSNTTTNIPGPKAWPIIGNLDLLLGVDTVEKALKAFTKMASVDEESPLSRFWLGRKLVILVKSPKYIEALLTHRCATAKDDFFYRSMREATGNGVFTRSGEAWHRMRKPLAMIVQPKRINGFQEVICRKVERLCVDLNKKANEDRFNISSYIKLCSLEVIFEVGLGVDTLECFGDDKFKIVHRIEKEMEEIFIDTWNFMSALGLKQYSPKKAKKEFIGLLLGLVEQRKLQCESEGRNYLDDNPENYIDVVLRTGALEGKTAEETAILLVDFVIGGADTQSIVIIVLLTILAIYPNYQDKVYEELEGIFGDSDRRPDEADLQKMVYLDVCIKEALRICCPPAVGRKADENIEIDGYIIPKGSSLLFTLYHTMKNPAYWEKPDDFFPDHFLPEAVSKRPKGAYLPFVAGPKMCPGQLYSYQMMKTIVSTLVRKYRFFSDKKFSELQFKYLIMREPVDPLLNLTHRIR